MVIKHSSISTTSFKSIKRGEVFLYQMLYLMAIEPIEDVNEDIYNAINIENGELYIITDNDAVTRVKGAFVIE